MPSPYYERQKAALTAKDYSGHIPVMPAQAPVQPSSARDLVDEMIAKSNEAREHILRHLIENPGVVATFGHDFTVEFGDLEIQTLDDVGLRDLNQYGVRLVQTWHIRRREEDDRPALGGDSRGEERSGGQDPGAEFPAAPGLRILP